MALQADGKAVIVGGTATNFALARFNTDGTLDASFGSGGKVHTNIAGRADLVSSAALQADGKVVIAGRVGADGGALPDVGVLRYDAAGQLDAGFGTAAGSARIDYGAGEHDEATAVAILPDGRIVLAVQLRSGGVYRHALAGLQAHGTPDNGFGQIGLALQSFAVGGDFARALAIQPDGRIVTAGYTRRSPTQTSELDDFLVTRHDSDGSLDAAFGTGGTVVVDFFGASDGAECVRLQADGRIVAAGLARNGSTNGLALVRVLP
jgi:uncharacterized delta-60 repeat protein